MTLRVVSFGGGVQSTALLVLAAQGRIEYRRFVFANVGEDSENPDTLAYLAAHSRPFAAAHGLELVELRKHTRGEPDSVLGRLRRTKGSIGIPVRMSTGAPARRACTLDFKIRVIARWLKEHGATPEDPAIVGIGFSVDEIARASSTYDARLPWQVKAYPLLDLRLSRNDCLNVVRAAGLPPPPKSACWFCPFHRPAEWQRMQREDPEHFERSCALEEFVNDRRRSSGKDPVYFTRFGRPLREVFAGGVQLTLADLDDGTCDSGFCWR